MHILCQNKYCFQFLVLIPYNENAASAFSVAYRAHCIDRRISKNAWPMREEEEEKEKVEEREAEEMFNS